MSLSHLPEGSARGVGAAHVLRGPCVTWPPCHVQVQRKLPWFLASAPSQACAKGGAGAYTDLIQMDAGDPTGVAGLSAGRIKASALRTAYVPLSSQAEFIQSLRVRLQSSPPPHPPGPLSLCRSPGCLPCTDP